MTAAHGYDTFLLGNVLGLLRSYATPDTSKAPLRSPFCWLADSIEATDKPDNYDAERHPVVVANLGEDTVDGSLAVDVGALGLPASAAMRPVQAEGTQPPQVDGRTLRLDAMPPLAFGGALIVATPR